MCSLCWVYFAGNRSRQYPFSPAHLTYFDETLMSKEPPQEKPRSCGRSTLAGLAGLAGLASLSGLSVVELWRQGPRPSRARNAPRHLSATRPDPATPVNISGRTERATDRATRVALPFNRGALRDRFLTFIRSRRGLPQLSWRLRPRPALLGQPSAIGRKNAEKKSLAGHRGLVIHIGARPPRARGPRGSTVKSTLWSGVCAMRNTNAGIIGSRDFYRQPQGTLTSEHLAEHLQLPSRVSRGLRPI